MKVMGMAISVGYMIYNKGNSGNENIKAH